jgi:hypothetical protein
MLDAPPTRSEVQPAVEHEHHPPDFASVANCMHHAGGPLPRTLALGPLGLGQMGVVSRAVVAPVDHEALLPRRDVNDPETGDRVVTGPGSKEDHPRAIGATTNARGTPSEKPRVLAACLGNSSRGGGHRIHGRALQGGLSHGRAGAA